MTAQEFFYWLQGFIELAAAGGGDFTITQNVAQCILSHADLVPENERGEGLIEVRTLVRLISRSTSESVARSLTADVVEVVGRVFLHVIDPKAGGAEMQEKLNAIHNQNTHLRPHPPTGTGGLVARC